MFLLLRIRVHCAQPTAVPERAARGGTTCMYRAAMQTTHGTLKHQVPTTCAVYNVFNVNSS